MKLNIKNIVCPCCEMYVKSTARELGLEATSLHLGELTLAKPATDAQIESFGQQLRLGGLELMQEAKNLIVERMKSVMHELVNQNEDLVKINLSSYLSDRMHYNYSYLSNLFTKAEGITIRDYCINLRIESAKRMLLFEGYDLAEVACRLNYSSVAHFAAQFKKVTGMTSSEFKRAYWHGNPSPQLCG